MLLHYYEFIFILNDEILFLFRLWECNQITDREKMIFLSDFGTYDIEQYMCLELNVTKLRLTSILIF